MDKKHFTFLAVIVLLCNACEKTLEFDIPESKPLLVVNSFITNGDFIKVEVSSSLSYLDPLSEIPVISGAEISLTGEGTSFNLIESESISGTYYSQEPVSNEGTYNVQVAAEGLKTVNASTIIPSAVNGEVELLGNTESEYEFRLTFDDVPNSEDYYHLMLIKFSETWPEGDIHEFRSNDEILLSSGADFSFEEDNYYYDSAVFKDDLFENSQASIRFKTDFWEEEVDYKLQLIRSSREYFDYHQSYRAFQNSGGPFSQPVQVYTNIDNGIGVFGGYSFIEIPLEY